ncbi:cyclopropane-fatty-acyl-phospholipid synthase [Lewinella marina]|uniref:Cyclopropane-fatty-acyl-phospholipid synthase n=1 Tax=Neolewinella marina TaxID=438751 RepID=A0A2G0CJI8_9BACT|nr:cyclopropane fatty acyl phospholipid synthase [Neolewinella marina]NJB84700.1 cyclopropane-fatty-acyl-phospholipid synthase [Neolewinella marina]PHL00134.1 cyclopropane-fatty-acyl-phospholipid synthase [Neolewinella marina]
MSTAKQTVTDLLSRAGIVVNGRRPVDLQVHRERFYDRVLAEGILGFGESYMDGDWDCEALDDLITQVLRANLAERVRPLKMFWPVLRAKISNQQRKSKALRVGEQHYDIGNDLYERMLDRRMTYTCAYWKNATTLDEAQEAKLDLVCRKIGLQPGMKVLDIGCGWGSFAGYAAERYGVSVVGVTISKEQLRLARERYGHLDVEFRFQDYREVDETFDHVVSLGMFEHVGPKNHHTFMRVVDRCLSDDGLFLLHTIGTNLSRIVSDAWTDKYIFPGGVAPSALQITRAAEGLFTIKDWHNFGGDYDRTLLAWYANFERHRGELTDYDERFYRMWRFFLLTAAGGFRSHRNHLWQIVFAKPAGRVAYDSVR